MNQPPNPGQKYMVGPQGPSQPYGTQPYGSQPPYASQPPPAPYGAQPGAQPPYGSQPPYASQPGAQPPYGSQPPPAPYGSQPPPAPYGSQPAPAPYGSQPPPAPYGSQPAPYGAQPGAPGAQPPYGARPGAPGAQPPYGSQPPPTQPYGAQPPYGSQAPPPGQYGAPAPAYGAPQPGAPAPYGQPGQPPMGQPGQPPMGQPGQPPMASLQGRPGTYAASPVSMNPPLARISLVKGQNVSLTKAAPNLRRARVGLGWDVRQTWGAPFDLDASVFLLNAQNLVANPMSFIFYNNRQSYDGSIVHYGDNLTGAGEGDDEQVSVDLTRVPADIQRIVFVCSIYEAEIRHQNFGMVQRAFIRIVDQDSLQEIVRFDLTEEASMWNCILFGELYRYGPEWKFKALGQGIQGGLRAAGAQFGMQLA